MRSFLLESIIVSILSIKSIPPGGCMRTRGFLSSRKTCFDRLCAALRLEPGAHRPDHVSAHAGAVRVCLERHREDCFLSVGSSAADRPACPVETLAERLEGTCGPAHGESGETVARQAEFIVRHWSELQRMFSPQGIAETEAWMAARKAAVIALYADAS